MQGRDIYVKQAEKREKWITVGEALKLSGCCPRTFYARVHKARVPRRKSRLDGRKRLVSVVALERAMNVVEGSYQLRLVP